MSTPSVSVVVCARNEYTNLSQLLPLLTTQEYPDYEVVVVDDRSTDETEDYLRNSEQAGSRIRYVRVKEIPDHVNSKKYALTLGIKAARNEIILVTDADCRPAGTQWIKYMAGCIDNSTDIVLGYSPYQKVPGALNRFIQYETLLTAFQYLGWAMAGKPYMGVGRNLSYRKSMFINNKGFNQHIGITGGDDDLFVNRHASPTNTRVVLNPEAFMESLPKRTWKAYFNQKLRHLSVGRYYKLRDKLRLGMFSLSHILVWVIGLVLCSIPETRWPGAGILALRTIVFVVCLSRVSRMLQSRLNAMQLIFLDFIYVIYYLSTGLTALAKKRISWRN